MKVLFFICRRFCAKLHHGYDNFKSMITNAKFCKKLSISKADLVIGKSCLGVHLQKIVLIETPFCD